MSFCAATASQCRCLHLHAGPRCVRFSFCAQKIKMQRAAASVAAAVASASASASAAAVASAAAEAVATSSSSPAAQASASVLTAGAGARVAANKTAVGNANTFKIASAVAASLAAKNKNEDINIAPQGGVFATKKTLAGAYAQANGINKLEHKVERAAQPEEMPLVLPLKVGPGKLQRQLGLTRKELSKFEDKVALTQSLLQSGNLDRAESVFHQILATSRYAEHLTPNLFNFFIAAWVRHAHESVGGLKGLEAGLYWFTRMKIHGVDPNPTTFAIIIQGMLRKNLVNAVRDFFATQVSRVDLHTLQNILHHPFLGPELEQRERELFDQILVDLKITRNSFDFNETTICGKELQNLLEKEEKEVRERMQKLSCPDSILQNDSEKDALPVPVTTGSLGLRILRNALDNVKKTALITTANNQEEGDTGQEDLFVRYAAQLRIEEQAYQDAMLALLDNSEHAGRGSMAHNKTLAEYVIGWHGALQSRLIQEANTSDANKSSNPEKSLRGLVDAADLIAPLVKVLGAEKLSMITTFELLPFFAGRRVHRAHKESDIDELTAKQTTSSSDQQENVIGSTFEEENDDENETLYSEEAEDADEEEAVDELKVREAESESEENVLPKGVMEETTVQQVKLGLAAISVGRAVMAELNAQMLDTKGKGTLQSATGHSENLVLAKHRKHCFLGQRINQGGLLLSQQHRMMYALMMGVKNEGVLDGIDDTPDAEPADIGVLRIRWSVNTTVRIGVALLDLFLDSAKIKVPDPTGDGSNEIEVPAFFHTFVNENRHLKHGVIRMNRLLLNVIGSSAISLPYLSPKFLPMVVPPRPWLTYRSGGYLSNRKACMRFRNRCTEQHLYLRAADDKMSLTKVLSALDVLGSVAWRVNRKILAVVLEIWNSGAEFCGIPEHIDAQKAASRAPKKPIDYETNISAAHKYRVACKKHSLHLANSYSNRCSLGYTIETARALVDLDLYFPHNMDFRGRAYPVPPFLNHVGSDMCRGLLTFAKKKPLGKRGWVWLQLHLAGLYGIDKASFKDRLAWVHENMSNIEESAKNPLRHKWWLNSEHPWQTLAACIEISNAVDAGTPELYESGLPVHQDGSCNGLQHYAALGRDEVGAKMVSLVPALKPADLYSEVARKVKDLVIKDIEGKKNGHDLAKIVLPVISRKLVKQTVMTSVYGVTYYGAREQIANRLKELKFSENEEVQFKLANYVAKLVFMSFTDVCKSATQIQTWLNVIARIISKSIPSNINSLTGYGSGSRVTPVIWTTPLGLTCVQPYRAETFFTVETSLQSLRMSDPKDPGEVDSRRQSSAFPPNFVHSLDATHMMMTALECYSKNITFAAVHDSYWCHASDTDLMRSVLKTKFVELHSKEILNIFINECRLRYKDHVIPAAELDLLMAPYYAKYPRKGEPEIYVSECDNLATSEFTVRGKPRTCVPLRFPPVPTRGNFDIKSILESEYFFH